MSAKVYTGPELRVLPIEADGQIKALSAVGCAGTIGPNNTPARRGQVLFDEDGFQVAIHKVDHAKREVTLRMHEGVKAGFRGVVTGFHSHFNAYVDRLCLILGPRERSFSQELGNAQSLVRSPDGLYVFWLCTSEEASEIMSRVHVIARKAVVEAWNGPPGALKKAGWWLSRASESPETIMEAAAALLHTGDEDAARTVLQASDIDPNQSRTQITMTCLRLDREANR